MTHPIGFPNLGNTCWLSALLQALMSSNHFLYLLANIPFVNKPFTNKLRTVVDQCLKQHSSNVRVALIDLIRSVNWTNGIPQDSDEAILWLISNLHNEHAVNVVAESEENEYMRQIIKHNFNETSTVYNIFQGCLRWTTSDNELRYEPFTTFYLSWVTPENGVLNVTDCLKKTFETKEIVVLPPLLMISFDRTNERLAFNLTTQFSIMSTIEDKVIKYVLRGVIIHLGGMAGGHYISIGTRDDEWWLFDDDRVVKFNQSDSLIRDVPRVLVYDRVQ